VVCMLSRCKEQTACAAFVIGQQAQASGLQPA